MRIGVDVMGGDNAPDEILKGCIEALELLAPDDTLVLIGPEATIKEHLAERGVEDARIEIADAPSAIAMDESPSRAVRAKLDSSSVRMARLGSHKSD